MKRTFTTACSGQGGILIRLMARRIAFTMAGGGQAALIFGLMARRIAFTMAEILLSLTIIGVVAAITLPSLTGNINERTWNTQRKALFARMSQAVSLMPALNGYGISTSGTSSAVDTATETFITAGLSKVLKINNVCDAEHVADCGIPSTITPMDGSQPIQVSEYLTFADYIGASGGASFIPDSQNTKAAALETANGESILVYYYPYCKVNEWYYNENSTDYPQPYDKTCVNFVYDLNGTKGPNTMGKDVGFITVFNPYDPIVVAPMPLSSNAGRAKQTDASALCTQQDSESRLPNREELAAMFVNDELARIPDMDNVWSSSVYSENPAEAWAGGTPPGDFYPTDRNIVGYVRCIKR